MYITEEKVKQTETLHFPREFHNDDKYEQSVTSAENHIREIGFDMEAHLTKCGPKMSNDNSTKELIRDSVTRVPVQVY